MAPSTTAAEAYEATIRRIQRLMTRGAWKCSWTCRSLASQRNHRRRDHTEHRPAGRGPHVCLKGRVGMRFQFQRRMPQPRSLEERWILRLRPLGKRRPLRREGFLPSSGWPHMGEVSVHSYRTYWHSRPGWYLPGSWYTTTAWAESCSRLEHLGRVQTEAHCQIACPVAHGSSSFLVTRKRRSWFDCSLHHVALQRLARGKSCSLPWICDMQSVWVQRLAGSLVSAVNCHQRCTAYCSSLRSFLAGA
mmetsp:Transcript_58248/g.136199  ORF Transcript_58248/g.136199 Transcript_58248/m.136199 type:complete len:247 (+) Transcript_58248:2029-2769(+)